MKIKWLVLLMLATISCSGEQSMYEIFNFIERDNGNVTLVFKKKVGVKTTRKLGFRTKERFIYVKTESLKGVVEWKSIKDISYREVDNDKGIITVRIDDENPSSKKTITFGEISLTHWNVLLDKFGSFIKFKGDKGVGSFDA